VPAVARGLFLSFFFKRSTLATMFQARLRILLTVIVPVGWLLNALLSFRFGGGENIAFAIALAPGLILAPTGNPNFLNLALGFVAMALAGLFLDWIRLTLHNFLLSLSLGGILAIALVTFFFLVEASNSRSFSTAYRRFDFDQPERVIAWAIFCIALALYFSIVLAWFVKRFSRVHQEFEDCPPL
jgi:hypothetical protein